MSESPECLSESQRRGFVPRDAADARPAPLPVSALPKLRLFCLIAFSLGLVLTGRTVLSQEPSSTDFAPVLGWRGTYLIGAWAEATFNFEAPTAGDYEVRVTAPDPDGHRVTFSSRVKLSPGRHILRGMFKVGQTDPEIELAVTAAEAGKSVLSWRSSGQSGRPVPLPLNPAVRLIITVGNPPGFDGDKSKTSGPASADNASGYRTVDVDVAELPVDARAYDSVTLLVIAGPSVLSPAQADALRHWIASGGRVVISLPADLNRAREILEPFSSWIPVTLAAAPVTVSEFGKLESYARKNVRIPFAGRMPIPSVKISQGEVLAGSRDEALLVRSPYGLGSVTVLSLDVTQPPLSKWTELPALGRRLAETSDQLIVGRPSRSLQLSSTGITDLATQLHASQDDFAHVNRASPWFVMGLLVLLLLAIGPLDYVIVHRLLQRPRATWLTFPILVGLAVVLPAKLASTWNGTSFRANQLNILNLDVDSSTCHQRLWTNIYSPVTERRSVSVRSAIAPASAEIQTGWSGVAETAFGGMLRPASVQVGMADYRLADDAVIDGLPLMEWSSKPLLTEIHSSMDGLVESHLQSNGVGQLSGTVTHRLPGPIEDWFLAYGNRVYLHKKKRDDIQTLPLASRQILRVDQPNVFPRELRAYLTGKVITGRTGSQATDVASQFAAYDPGSRNPADVLRILTFHNEVGGTTYTELTNRLLENEDLSHLLKLGRAVLFGRLNSPVASIKLHGHEIGPDRETTFIRIVLPVTKVGTNIKRVLERLDK